LITNYQHKKVADYLRIDEPSKVCLIFHHGLGDVIMFIPVFYHLRKLFPKIQIDLALLPNVGQQELIQDVEAIYPDRIDFLEDEYDYSFVISYPMSEQHKGAWTKSEWCCLAELGIDPINYYPEIQSRESPLVACHFQATALPDPCNPSPEVANFIWNEIIDAGFIPIEAYFKHTYYNPKNEKFSFIDCTCRSCQPNIDNLIGLLQRCFASICVASGNLPLSIAMMPERTLYLKKEYSIQCYTKMDIESIDVKNYKKGYVKKWLKLLQSLISAKTLNE